MCVASSNAAAARGGAQASVDRKLSHCRDKITELRNQGTHHRPLVWAADGRPHRAVARKLQYAADNAVLVGVASRCRRNRFSADGNMNFWLLFSAGEQPWHEQFCQILRHGQSGSSPASWIWPCTTGVTSSLLTVDLGTRTPQTQRLTAIPDDDDDIASLSSPPSASLQPSSLQSRAPALAGQLASALLMFPGALDLDALFEDHGMSWLVIEDVFALEWATYRRCFPAQPPLAARQRLNRQKCANLIQDLVDDAALQPQSAHFSLQLLDLAHRGLKGKKTTITSSTSSPWRPQSTS